MKPKRDSTGKGNTPIGKGIALDDLGDADLFAKISHEVRTPLNSIIGFSEMMKAESFGPLGHEKYRGYVDDIHTSAQHALSLINDLLDMSKLQAGAFEIRAEPLAVNDLVEECVSAMEPMATKAMLDVNTTFAQDLSLIEADRRALKQVLFNILSNAIKFTPSGGHVSVATLPTPNHGVLIRVEDTGTGMDDDEVSRAFEPFQQLGASSQSLEGTGLGLPLARALAEANGAEFVLKSRPGSGTCVEIAFEGLAQGLLGI